MDNAVVTVSEKESDYEDMASLINEFGESCLDKPLPYDPDIDISVVTQNYKGLKIIRNIDKSNGTIYFTVVNDKNNVHIHTKTRNSARKICGCYLDMTQRRDISKYCKYYRKEALGLAGFNIKHVV